MNTELEFLNTAFLKNIELTGKSLKSFPWTDPEAYSCWLSQTYYFVSHTTTFLSLSASRFGPKNKEALNQILSHLREETGHEKLLIDDLGHMDRKLRDFLEFPETSLFYQSQYYWINNDHPASHAGYSLFLEGLAAEFGASAFGAVSKAFGSDAASFLKVHDDADKKHFQDGLVQLANLDKKILTSVIQNLEQSYFLYSCIIDKAKNVKQIKTKNSA